MTIGDRIKSRRQELDMTLEDVAGCAKTGRATIHKYETGLITNIPSDKIERIAEALQTTPAYLMGWDDMTFPEASTGVIDIKEELEALLSRINSSHTATFSGKEMTGAEKTFIENTLQSALDNLKIIVNSRD